MRTLLYATCLSAVSTVAAAQGDVAAVSGSFQPLNPAGEDVSGTVSVTPEGDMLAISLTAEGFAPGMHLAHIHGFPEDMTQNATCPDASADANGDGWVDLMETEDQAGITMIPFTDAPASLAIHSDSYPSAGNQGLIIFEQTVDLAELRDAVETKFGTPLALSNRVVFIHGVPEGSDLPESVQSLEGVPANVTIPIACAELDATDE